MVFFVGGNEITHFHVGLFLSSGNGFSLPSNPHIFGSSCVPKTNVVCLSELRLERLENRHLFWKNEWKKAGKHPKKLTVFGWIFCHWPVATLSPTTIHSKYFFIPDTLSMKPY